MVGARALEGVVAVWLSMRRSVAHRLRRVFFACLAALILPQVSCKDHGALLLRFWGMHGTGDGWLQVASLAVACSLPGAFSHTSDAANNFTTAICRHALNTPPRTAEP